MGQVVKIYMDRIYGSWHGANPVIPEEDLMAACIIHQINAEPFPQCIHLSAVTKNEVSP